MTRMDQVVAEQDNGFRRRQRVKRKGWIRDEAYESSWVKAQVAHAVPAQ